VGQAAVVFDLTDETLALALLGGIQAGRTRSEDT
jgi:hypothetical protein